MTPGPRPDMIVIGASAGGVQALRQLFGRLPADLAATVAVVIHRSPFAESMLAEVLHRSSRLPVSEPKHAERFAKGRIYLAPRDHHLLVEDGRLLLTRGAKEHYTRPAVDPLFRSAAQSCGRRYSRHRGPMPYPPDAPSKIRHKLEVGLLPHVPPPRMWAGQGDGHPCAGCELPILPDQVEYEFGNGDVFRMHLGCAALWEAERRRKPSN